MFTFSPMPHSEAVSRIAGLPLVSREVMDELLPELRAYAFTVTGLDRFDQLAKVRDVIAAVPAGEQTWAKARKEIAAELSEDLGGKVAQRRAELLLRTHVFRSYAASRYRRLMQQVDVFPFWQYKTHGDGNVRPSHAALNGKIFPAGHDIWQRIFPPWDWGCRCLVVPLTKRSADAVLQRGKPTAQEAQDANLLPTQIVTPERFSDREADLISKNERLPNGVPLLPAPTWASSPWGIPGNVKHDWKLIEKRYDDQPEVLAAFKDWAKDAEIPGLDMTVDEWLGADGADTRRMVRAYKKRIFAPLDAALAKKGGKSVFKQPLHRTASGLVIDLTPDEEAEMLRLMRDRGELRLGEPLRPLSEIMEHSEKVTAFESEVVGDTHENGATWALDGTEKERKRSPSKNNVKMTTRFLHGSVFSHNHPKGSPPSLADIEKALDALPAEVRVVTGEHLHRVQLGRASRPQLTLQKIPGVGPVMAAADAVAETLGGSEAFKAANSARVVLDWLARQGYINYERISR
jgi:SPP1 gp7 family putative phage head morphogenesis protein